MSASVHNATVRKVMLDLLQAAAGNRSQVCVMAESFILGAAMLRFPTDPRAQAQLIQAIADGAADRVQSVSEQGK